MNKMERLVLLATLLTNTIATIVTTIVPQDDIFEQTTGIVKDRNLKGATASGLCRELDRLNGFTCSCIDSTDNGSCDCSDQATSISCIGDQICQDKVCGRFLIDAQLQSNELTDLKICVDYVEAPLGFLDGCFQVFFLNNVVAGCQLQFETDSRLFETCSDCRVCMEKGGEGFEIECDNIESYASTDGCLVEDIDKIFPGFRSNGMRRILAVYSVAAFIAAFRLGF